MEIVYKSKSPQDFAFHLKKTIAYLDGKIFEKPAKVSISSSNYINNGAACFASKRLLFRLLGLPDDYIIFENSKHLEIISKVEYMTTACAAHEVRHRFQHYNNCLISVEFTRQSKYFPKGMIDYLYKTLHPIHGRNVKVFNREFDASLLESYIVTHYKNPKLSFDLIVEILKCNEKNIETVLAKLY